MKSNETKTYGSIRKIKAYGTCGVILGLAALAVATAQTSYADEVSKAEPTTVAPANTATNLSDSQPAQTQGAQQTIAQANQAQGTVNVTVDNSQVDQAVQQAKDAGVKVVQDSPVDKGTTNSLAETKKAQGEIAQDQAAQVKTVKQVTDNYVQAKSDHQKEVDAVNQKNTQIAAENKALKEAYTAASQQATQANQAVADAEGEIKKEFKDAQVTKTEKKIPVDPESKASYDSYTKAVEGVKKQNQESVAAYVDEKRKEYQKVKETNDFNADIRKKNRNLKNSVDNQNKEIADFNKKVSENNKAEDDRVARERAKAEQDKHKDGYLSEVAEQGLVYKSEKDAQVSIKGAKSYMSSTGLKKAFEDVTKNLGAGDLQQYVTYFSQAFGDKLELTNDPSRLSSGLEWYQPKTGNVYSETPMTAVNAEVGKTVTVTYSNLKNSSYKGKSISRVEVDVTVLSNSKNIKEDYVLGVFQDPGKGMELAARSKDHGQDYDLNYEVAMRFYDANGNKITFEDTKDGAKGLLAASSINAYKNHVEALKPSDSARFVPITGSSIVKHSNGYVYSNEKDNSNGNHFGLNQHNIVDSTTSPYYWYVGGALALKGSDPTFEMRVTSWDQLGDRKGEGRFTPSIWFTLTSELSATGVPTSPRYKTPKDPVEYKPEPEKPISPSNLKLELVTVNGVPKPQEKPGEKVPDPLKPATVQVHGYKLSTRPQIAKVVENADKVNINGQYVAKNSLNRFVLQTEALAAGRKAVTQLVFNDHLPQGFKADLEKTKEANKGYDVSYNEKTNLMTFKAVASTLASVNQNLNKEYKLADLSVWGRPQNDAADYENVFEMVVNGGGSNGYVRKSNKVLIHTPGKPQPNKPNDPKNPNHDPLKPEKHNYNAAGKLVDGKEMLPEGINYYVSKWTNRPNKNDKSGKEAIAKGFAYIEDYQDDAVTPLESRFQEKDAQGKAVKGLKMYHVLSRETLSKELNDLIDRSGISPKGKFYMWVAEKPEEFYKAYVQTGMDLFFHTPMKNKTSFKGKYTNQTFQVQFGNGYYSNVVVNHVPELKVQKQVFSKLGDGQNLDGKLVKLGDKFYYFLDGAKLPADRGEALKEYRFYDDFDEKGDEFTGQYKAMAAVDIKLKDGTVIKAGTDLSQYAELKHNKAKGVVEISMKQDFLDKVDNASEFDVDAAIQMKRIAAGTFENTYKNVVNGHEIVSNTVKTTTPEPEKPQPKTPTPAPTAQKPALPETGEHGSNGLAAFGLAMLAGFGLFGLKKRKEMN